MKLQELIQKFNFEKNTIISAITDEGIIYRTPGEDMSYIAGHTKETLELYERGQESYFELMEMNELAEGSCFIQNDCGLYFEGVGYDENGNPYALWQTSIGSYEIPL